MASNKNNERNALVDIDKLSIEKLNDGLTKMVAPANKKISSGNEDARLLFQKTWLTYVKKVGFTDRAEKFLYEGFVYCGATPFKTYIDFTENADIKMLLNGKYYGNNCADTTKMLMHLLTMYLNERQYNFQVISMLIKEISKEMINKKDKTVLKSLHFICLKYLLKKLRGNNELPSWDNLISEGLEPSVADKFASEILANIELDKKEENLKVIEMQKVLKKWLEIRVNTKDDTQEAEKPKALKNDREIPSKKDKIAKKVDDKSDEQVAAVITDANTLVEEKTQSDINKEEKVTTNTDENKVEENKTKSPRLSKAVKQIVDKLEEEKKAKDEIIAELSQKLKTAEAQNKKLEETINSKNSELKGAQERAAALEKRIVSLTNDLQSKIQLLDGANVKITELKQDIQNKDNSLSDKGQEISDLNARITFMEETAEHEKQLFLNKIKQRLRMPYRNFKSGENSQMDVTLGNNMRNDIKQIFKSLESLDIKFE